MPAEAHARPSDLDAIHAGIEKRHDESVKRLQDWTASRPSPPNTAA